MLQPAIVMRTGPCGHTVPRRQCKDTGQQFGECFASQREVLCSPVTGGAGSGGVEPRPPLPSARALQLCRAEQPAQQTAHPLHHGLHIQQHAFRCFVAFDIDTAQHLLYHSPVESCGADQSLTPGRGCLLLGCEGWEAEHLA